MPNALVRLPELKYPENGVNLAPISNAITDLRKQQEFDATHGLAQERMGMERERLDIAKRQAGQQESDNEVKQIAGVAQLIDQMKADDPQRAGAWSKLVTSRPTFGPALQKYGIDPADHINGPKFLLAQARGPVDEGAQKERDARIAQSKAATAASQSSTNVQNFELTSRMHEVARQQGMYINDKGELSFNQGLVPAAFTPGQTRPQGGEPTTMNVQLPRETRDQARTRTVEELGPTVKPQQQGQEQAPSEADVQRYWSAVYGQKPPSGQKYGRDGGLINMKGSADDKTRAAIKGALSSATDNINDAREALRKTNWGTRDVQRALGTGVPARVEGPMRIAIRGVLHGISGAQINIPEQAEYFDAMLPRYFDLGSTIEFKLNHLENTLAHIRKFTDGGYSEDQMLAIRNAMRGGLKLSPLTAAEAKQRVDDRPKGGGASNPALKGMSNEELLRRLNQ